MARRRSASQRSGFPLHEARQAEALVALARSMGPQESLSQVVASLFCHVALPSGENAFLQEEVREAISAASASTEVCELPVEVAKLLAKGSSLSFKSIVGQVLWRHHGSKVLEEYRSIVEDIEWVSESASEVATFSLEAIFSQRSDERGFLLAKRWREVATFSLEAIFSQRSDERGFLLAKRWREVVETVVLNPLLRNRIWLTNADQLFFAERCKGSTGEIGVTFRQFKKLLLQLSDLLQVHPCIVFVSLCSHCEDPTTEPPSTADPK